VLSNQSITAGNVPRFLAQRVHPRPGQGKDQRDCGAGGVAAEFYRAWHQSWKKKMTLEAVVKKASKRDKLKRERENAELVPLHGEQEETSPGGIVEMDGELYIVTAYEAQERRKRSQPSLSQGSH
jgi:hypothetical protein